MNKPIKLWIDFEYYKHTADAHPSPLLFPLLSNDAAFRKYNLYVSNFTKYFTGVEEQSEADFLVPAYYYNKQKKHDNRTMELSIIADNIGKKILIFQLDDYENEIPVKNALIFRSSAKKSTLKENEFILPAWCADFMIAFRGNTFVSFGKSEKKPAVCFCGHLSPFRKKVIKALCSSKEVTPRIIGNVRGWTSRLKSEPIMKMRKQFVDNALSGHYALCIRGTGNFSYRLYEVLSMGRIPVFINTDCALPYDWVINYKDIFVWIEQSQIADIGRIIRKHYDSQSNDSIIALQNKCRALFLDYLSIDGWFSKFHLHFERKRHGQQ